MRYVQRPSESKYLVSENLHRAFKSPRADDVEREFLKLLEKIN